MALVGLVAQQFYIYWLSGTFSCCFCNPGDVDHVSRFQRPTPSEVCNTRPYYLATHILHRLFVIVQFLLVLLQSAMYVLVLVNRDQIYVADWYVFQDMPPLVRVIVRFLYTLSATAFSLVF
jgi:hypothetical protein